MSRSPSLGSTSRESPPALPAEVADSSTSNYTCERKIAWIRVVSNLDEAARTADLGRRRSLLEQAEKMMLGDYPVIPLYHFVSKRLVKPYLKEVEANPLNRVASKSLSLLPH